MKDMLVRLLELPSGAELEQRLLEKEKIVVRRAIAPEKHLVSDWVGAKIIEGSEISIYQHLLRKS
jgi:hypothetical protein